jgi:hypothetical protein
LPVRALWLPLALSVLATCPSSAATLDSTEVRRWSEDLDFLAREMPAHHANLFHAMPRASFDSALSSIRGRLPSLARHQVIVELEKLAARIGDGHSNVSPWRDTVIAFSSLPVAFYRFADGYRIRAATKEQSALLGAKVTHIGSRSIADAESLVAQLISRDNAMGIPLYAPWLMQMPEVLHALGLAKDRTEVELTIEQGAKTRRIRLEPVGRFPNYSGDTDRSWNPRPGWVDLRDRSPAPLWLSRSNPRAEATLLPAQPDSAAR